MSSLRRSSDHEYKICHFQNHFSLNYLSNKVRNLLGIEYLLMILSMCLLVISTSKLDMINVIQICIQNDNSFILSSFRFNNNR